HRDLDLERSVHQGDREGAVVAAGRVRVPVRGPVGSAVHGRNLRSNGVVVCAICTNAWTPDGRRGETRGHAGPTEDHLAERRSWCAANRRLVLFHRARLHRGRRADPRSGAGSAQAAGATNDHAWVAWRTPITNESWRLRVRGADGSRATSIRAGAMPRTPETCS